MQRYYYSRNLQYFCPYFCMKITFFLLISPKCVRTHTLVNTNEMLVNTKEDVSKV